VIAPATTVGAVHLTVADLPRSLTYYTESIGLEVLGLGDGEASLGAGGSSEISVASASSRIARGAMAGDHRRGVARVPAHRRVPGTGVALCENQCAPDALLGAGAG